MADVSGGGGRAALHGGWEAVCAAGALPALASSAFHFVSAPGIILRPCPRFRTLRS